MGAKVLVGGLITVYGPKGDNALRLSKERWTDKVDGCHQGRGERGVGRLRLSKDRWMDEAACRPNRQRELWRGGGLPKGVERSPSFEIS